MINAHEGVSESRFTKMINGGPHSIENKLTARPLHTTQFWRYFFCQRDLLFKFWLGRSRPRTNDLHLQTKVNFADLRELVAQCLFSQQRIMMEHRLPYF